MLATGGGWKNRTTWQPPYLTKPTGLQPAIGNNLQKYNRIVFFAVGIEPTNVCLEGKLTTIVMRLFFAETILKLIKGLQTKLQFTGF
jgi:hypothetical protein